jgi:hypothetical protein
MRLETPKFGFCDEPVVNAVDPLHLGSARANPQRADVRPRGIEDLGDEEHRRIYRRAIGALPCETLSPRPPRLGTHRLRRFGRPGGTAMHDCPAEIAA